MPILDLNSWRDEVEAKNIFDRPHIRICGKYLVGTGRFELPTPRTPSECSTRLSHVPTLVRTRGSNGVDSEILHLEAVIFVEERPFQGRVLWKRRATWP